MCVIRIHTCDGISLLRTAHVSTEGCFDPDVPGSGGCWMVKDVDWVDYKQPVPGSSLSRIAVTACFHWDSNAAVALDHMKTEEFDLVLELGE